jgi:hypothetical protein
VALDEKRGAARSGRLRRAAGNALLLVGSLALTCGAFEAGTRLLSDVGPSLLVVDAVRGKHWIDGYQGRVFVPEAGRAIHLRFHRDGFRGPDLAYAKAAGARRVAVLGDSMIAAVAVEEPETIVGRLAQGLNRDSAARGAGTLRTIEVMNFGVSSASTGQELVTYRQVARRYHPDVVVVAFNDGNDLADNCACLSRAHRLYFDLARDGRLVEHLDAPPAAALGAWLDRHSRFYVWQKTAFARLRVRLRAEAGRLEPGEEIFRTDGEAAIETAWRLTAALLEAIRAETSADGARLVLVLVPAPAEIYGDLWRALQRRAGSVAVALDRAQPPRRLGAIAAGLGVPFLDLGPALRQAAPGGLSTAEAEQVFFFGKYHLNEQGNRLAADAIRRFLETSGLL